MAHLAEDRLRRAVDEPAAISEPERTHLTTCARCRADLDAARADRNVLATLLEPPLESRSEPPLAEDLDSAWHRLAARLREDQPDRPLEGQEEPPAVAVPTPPRSGRPARSWNLRRPVVALGAAAIIAVGTTAAAAAASWLPIFHPATVTPVHFQADDLPSLPDLTAYGTLTEPTGVQPETVPDAATAGARTGLAVPTVTRLPTGVSGKPRYEVIPASRTTFTFSAAKARAAAAAAGRSLPPMPAGIDGSTLRLDTGPVVAEVWMQGKQLPALAVVRMPAPTLSTEGVSWDTLRGYLLAQPGIPAAVADQLRALPSNGSVLPIPVPSTYAKSSSTTVGGMPATLVTLRDQSGAALVWIREGTLQAVFGLVSPSDLRVVADDLG